MVLRHRPLNSSPALGAETSPLQLLDLFCWEGRAPGDPTQAGCPACLGHHV